jgi:putative heme-binding domain-containing protein
MPLGEAGRRTVAMTVTAALLALAVASALAQTPIESHPGEYDRADVEAGSRLYSSQCVACHGINGDMVPGVDLRRGLFKTVVSDDDLVRLLGTGRPDAGMPSFATLQPREVTGVVAFIRAGFDAAGTAVKVGDPMRGQALFTGKGACATCHRVNGRGPRTAADLSDIGAIRTPAALQRALLEPQRSLLPATRTVVAITRDGRTIRGRRLNEDTYTVQLLDEQERLVSLNKADLRTYDFVLEAAMPAADRTLAPDEVSDVIAYLLSLKGLKP